MVKKYQIFISATYEDLKEERKKVQDTILSMSQFPAGMEMFSASNEEPWEIVREAIDNSDFYVLIIGHKYGSVIEDGKCAGLSYTQREYYYALEKKIPVFVFLIANSVLITPDKMEPEAVKREKLEAFKREVMGTHHVEWWTNKDDLAAKVTVALYKKFNKEQRYERTTEQYLEKNETEREIIDLNQTGKEENENKQESKKEIIELDNKNKLSSIIKSKEKNIVLLSIGVIVIILFFSLRVFLINYNKENLQANETMEMREDSVQKDKSIELSKVNTQEDKKTELNEDNVQENKNAELYDDNAQENESIRLNEDNMQENKNREETQYLGENDEIIDWEWRCEENTGDKRRFLINSPSELGITVSYYQGI